MLLGTSRWTRGTYCTPAACVESKLPGYTLASGGRLPNKALLKRRARGEGSGVEMLPVMEAVEASGQSPGRPLSITPNSHWEPNRDKIKCQGTTRIFRKTWPVSQSITYKRMLLGKLRACVLSTNTLRWSLGSSPC